MSIRPLSIFVSVLIVLMLSWSIAGAAEPVNSTTPGKASPAEIQQAEGTEVVAVDDISSTRAVTVTLFGISRYEVVAMLNHLLENSKTASSVEQIETVFAPARPMRCRAVWKVNAYGTDTFGLESELFAAIRAVKTDQENDIFSGLLFTPEADDIALLKQIRPSRATEDSLMLIGPGLRQAPVMMSGSGSRAAQIDTGFD